MARGFGDEMMLAEWLFVNTVDDLRERSSNPSSTDRYSLLGIAPLLRKLLIDERPLVNTVKAARLTVPIEFRIVAHPSPTQVPGRQVVLSLGREEIVGSPEVAPVSLAQFTRVVIGSAQGNDVTVRDAIRYFANVEGGVHFGKAKTSIDEVLLTHTPSMFALGNQWIDVLGHIGAVVAGGLRPLEESIMATPTKNAARVLKDETGQLNSLHWTDTYKKVRIQPEG